MHNYRELKVWQSATCSIPLNIAEGSGNRSDKEFCRFLEIAQRSGYEMMTAIDIARGLGYWKDSLADELLKEASEIVAMAVGLMRKLGVNP